MHTPLMDTDIEFDSILIAFIFFFFYLKETVYLFMYLSISKLMLKLCAVIKCLFISGLFLHFPSHAKWHTGINRQVFRLTCYGVNVSD